MPATQPFGSLPKTHEVQRHRVQAFLELKTPSRIAIEACDACLRRRFVARSPRSCAGLAKSPGSQRLPGRDRRLHSGSCPGALRTWRRACTARMKHTSYQVPPAVGPRAFKRSHPAGSFQRRRLWRTGIGLSRERDTAPKLVSRRRVRCGHGESTARMRRWQLAEILAQAAELAETRATPFRRPSALGQSSDLPGSRITALLGQAIERTPPAERAAFWQKVVHSDRDLPRDPPGFPRTLESRQAAGDTDSH